METIKQPKNSETSQTTQKVQPSANLRPASGKSLLRHKRTWEGDDFEECLQAVYENRSQIEI